MWEFLRQLVTGDRTLVLGCLVAVTLLGLWGLGHLVVRWRRSRERRMLIALVLEMLERDVAPEDVTAVLRAMGLQRYDARFSIVRRRLFRHYARRRAAARARGEEANRQVKLARRFASRRFQPAG